MSNGDISEMIQMLIETCIPWVEEENGQVFFVDPVDKKEISAHYGASHAAASFIIYGETTGKFDVANIGYKLLDSVIDRWGTSSKLPGFHNDFNNFALCVVDDFLKGKGIRAELCSAIENVVLRTNDSNNPTTNWYPMRWYVNNERAAWTGNKEYNKKADYCAETIKKATFNDGFIDDRIPIGLSFNLQYDVATVAVMQFLRCKGESLDISKELGALLRIVAPDGDINYLGRGTNQVFAWGLWIFLLASSNQETELKRAVSYLKNRLPAMLSNHSMMLNEWPGEEKYMWWDYHYCSVYTAHVLLWLILSEMYFNCAGVEPKALTVGNSGLHIYNDGKVFAVTFDGREEYLSEKGPALFGLGIDGKMLVKGTFGPWQGMFGKKYAPVDVTLRNYCGLIGVTQNKDFSQNKFLRRLFGQVAFNESETIEPLFVNIGIDTDIHSFKVIYEVPQEEKFVVNVPLLDNSVSLQCLIDGMPVNIKNTMRVRNQYGWVNIWQSKLVSGKNVVIFFTMQD